MRARPFGCTHGALRLRRVARNRVCVVCHNGGRRGREITSKGKKEKCAFMTSFFFCVCVWVQSQPLSFFFLCAALRWMTLFSTFTLSLPARMYFIFFPVDGLPQTYVFLWCFAQFLNFCWWKLENKKKQKQGKRNRDRGGGTVDPVTLRGSCERRRLLPVASAWAARDAKQRRRCCVAGGAVGNCGCAACSPLCCMRACAFSFRGGGDVPFVFV
ncbi:monoglyceride lipase [Trypanosoma cruzi]|nr:monoglyceride lipase [Trypanosoma cruzi]